MALGYRRRACSRSTPGMIQLALGNHDGARRLLSRTPCAINPHFSIQYARAWRRRTLATLGRCRREPRGPSLARPARDDRRRMVLWPAGAALGASAAGTSRSTSTAASTSCRRGSAIDYVRRHGGDPDVPGDAVDRHGRRRDDVGSRGRGVGDGEAPAAASRTSCSRSTARPVVARGALRRCDACATARAVCRSSGSKGCSLPVVDRTGAIALPRRQRGRHDRLARDHRGRRGRRGDRRSDRAGGERERRAAARTRRTCCRARCTSRRCRRPFAPGRIRRQSTSSAASRSTRLGPGVEPGRVRVARATTTGSCWSSLGFALADGVRRLARPAPRAREDADGGVHGRLGDEGAPGRRRRFGGRRDAHRPPSSASGCW